MTEAQYNAARCPLIAANPGLVIPNDAMSVEFGPGPTDDEPSATGEQR